MSPYIETAATVASVIKPIATVEAPQPALFKFDLRNDVAAGLRFVLNGFGPRPIVLLHPDRAGAPAGRWLDELPFEDVAHRVEVMNRQGWNAYFHPNATTPGLAKKATEKDVVALHAAAWADIDARPGSTMAEVARDCLPLLPPTDLAIASGNGIQLIWPLPAPLPVTPANVARAQALCRRFAAASGGDAVHDIGRLLRLPFSQNWPNEKKRREGRTLCLSGLLHVEPQP